MVTRKVHFVWSRRERVDGAEVGQPLLLRKVTEPALLALQEVAVQHRLPVTSEVRLRSHEHTRGAADLLA